MSSIVSAGRSDSLRNSVSYSPALMDNSVHEIRPWSGHPSQGSGHKRQRIDNVTRHQQASYTPHLGEQSQAARDDKVTQLDMLDEESGKRLSRTGIRRELYHMAPESIVARVHEILDPYQHDAIFAHFADNMAPTLPFYVVLPGTSAGDMLNTKPILFLSMMNVACQSFVSASVHVKLETELVNAFADCIIRNGAKSLELVQAILVYSTWYNPAVSFEPSDIHQFVHIAGCMALDLGLGRPFHPNKARRGFGGPARNFPPGRLTQIVDAGTLEARRTWLHCYYIGAAVALLRRRPNLFRFSHYMQESIEMLETSPEACPSDAMLAQLIRLQKVTGDITETLALDDSSAPATSIADPKTLYAFTVCKQKLADWKYRLPSELADLPLFVYMYDAIYLYLHEIAMHNNHNIDDFRLPCTEESLTSGMLHTEAMTKEQVEAIETCIKTAHGLVNRMCTLPSDLLRHSPAGFWIVRCSYATLILVKLHVAVNQAGSEIAKFIKADDIAVVTYINKLCELYGNMAKNGMHKSLVLKNARVFAVIREWLLLNARKDSQITTQNACPWQPAPSRTANESKLQVLSEAATADAARSTMQGAYGSSTEQQTTTYGIQSSTQGLDYTSGITGGPSDSSNFDFDQMMADSMLNFDNMDNFESWLLPDETLAAS